MRYQKSTSNFGEQIATFRGRSIEPLYWILVFIPGTFIIIACYSYGTFLAANTFRQYGPAMALARVQSLFLLVTLSLIVLAAYFIFRSLIALQRISVFDKGLKYRSFFLRKRALLWSEISGISSSATMLTFFGKAIRTTPTGNIFPLDGKPIELSKGFQQLPKLIKIVKSKIYPLIWPRIKSAFRSGRSTQFGSLIIHRDHLQIYSQLIPWSTINRLHTDSGYLVVEMHDNSIRKIPIIDIPNLELLLKAVDWGIQ